MHFFSPPCVIIYNMKFHRKSSGGFTIVEILIVIVVIGILGIFVILAYPGVQTRVRNTSMVAGARQYLSAIEAYHAANGTYPTPPPGFADPADRGACLGEGYEGGVCLIEDVLEPNEVTNKAWLDDALKQMNSSLPELPVNVKWNSGGNELEAGALYAYTQGIADGSPYDALLTIYDIDTATAVIAYYLEGNVPQECKLPGSKSAVFLAGVHSTDKDITICVVPLGDVTYV